METKFNTIIILVPNLKEIKSREDSFHEFKFISFKAFNAEIYTYLYNWSEIRQFHSELQMIQNGPL